MFERRLKPKIAGIESAVIKIKLTATDFFLLHPAISINIATLSNTAIIVESAANDIKIKKRVPHILPPFILLNRLGSVMNKSDGPESG